MSCALPSFNLTQLAGTEITAFIENGFLIRRNAFSSNVADQIVPLVWNEMEESRDDPSTWTQPIRIVEKVLNELPIGEILTDRYRRTLDDLCGIGRWETNMGVGYWVNIFPQWPASTIEPRPLDFHIDTKTSVDPDAAPRVQLHFLFALRTFRFRARQAVGLATHKEPALAIQKRRPRKNERRSNHKLQGFFVTPSIPKENGRDKNEFYS